MEEQNRKESKPKEFRGKEYTLYEAKQRQRQMETAMRAQREKVQMLQDGGADRQEVMLQKAKYQGQLNEYAAFSRKMGLKEERERIYLDMRGKIATNNKTQNKLFPPEMIQNASKDVAQYKRYKEVLGDSVGSLVKFGQVKYNDSEKWKYLTGLKEYLEKYPISSQKYYDAGKKLEKLGIKNGLLLPKVEKQAFILPEGKHDPYHIMKRMMKRNITDDDVREYMHSAKAMFVQWGGKRQLFVSDEGMVLITKQGEEWIYKTVWSKYDYGEESQKIMEVLKDVGL